MTTEQQSAPAGAAGGPPAVSTSAEASGPSAAAEATGGAAPSAEGGVAATGASPPLHDEQQALWKTDKITEVQDTIDSLSLSLFEALRGLRDAVAPEEAAAQQQLAGGPPGPAAAGASGGDAHNTTAGAASSTAPVDDDPDYDDFLVMYHHKDPAAVALVADSQEGTTVPRTREEYVKLLARAEMRKDAELASRLAEEVLSKSEAVDDLVAGLPGMGRTREEQMKRIEELLSANGEAAAELKEACGEAERRREEVRSMLGRVTCEALGIEEEGR